jgi:hypothetical protein
MAKQSFSVGQVLTAAQMTSLQETAMGGGAASAKTANYVLVAADAGTTISMTSTSATTITVNTGLFAAGDTVFIQNLGSGTLTITAGTATVNTAGSLILPQYDAGILYFVSASSAIFYDYIQVGATSPLTTKGDIYVYGTSDTRLGVGANGTTLVADSSTATGLKWDTPASGGGMTLISTTSLTSGSTATLSSIPQTYKHLLLVISDVTATSDHYIDVKPNDTTNLKAHELEARASANINYESGNKVRLNLATAQKASGGDSSSAIDFYNYTSTTLKKHVRASYFYITGGDLNGSGHSYGTFTTSAISSLTINTNATFTAGTALLYGVS